VVFAIKKRRSCKEKERILENSFQPPLIVQWAPGPEAIQKPAPIAYVPNAQPTAEPGPKNL
jgi:hypothetical protein